MSIKPSDLELANERAARITEGWESAGEPLTTFCNVMAHELAANQHKGDPTEQSPLHHVAELLYHACKLYMAVRFNNKTAAVEYAADCGNHAWMLLETAGLLREELLTRGLEGRDDSAGLYDDDGTQQAINGLTLVAAENVGVKEDPRGIGTDDLQRVELERKRLVKEQPWTFPERFGGYYQALNDLSRSMLRQLDQLIKTEQEHGHFHMPAAPLGEPNPDGGGEL